MAQLENTTGQASHGGDASLPKMSHERMPLIAKLQIGRPTRRHRPHVLGRFCTVAFLSMLTCYLFLLFAALMTEQVDYHHGHDDDGRGWNWSRAEDGLVSFDRLKRILTETPEAAKAEEWSRYYTSGAHLAGQNYSQALWTKHKWEQFGIRSDIVSYDTYLNRPVRHRLALLHEKKGNWDVGFEATLAEDVLDQDPTSGLETRISTFHGYSATGNVTSRLVYVNYGTYQDFEDLIRANISLAGQVAIARYGRVFRGLKVKRAQDLGMVGCIIYSDPGDDGDATEAKGAKPYPDGPARQPSSVQRGSVEFLSLAPGDPTTPCYPSKPGVPRAATDQAIPSIPSIPISYLDAIPLLKALNGHGPRAEDFSEHWTQNTGLGYKDVEYNVGPSPADVVVNLVNEQDYSIVPIWNVIGIINGSVPDEAVVVGNHRDAWIVGGAGDPNSGSAVLNEVIRSFGTALQLGWKPRRTIVFASWDGEEYGLLGSTEWVEEYLPWLQSTNVAYLNLDTACTGPQFRCAAAPLLHELVRSVAAEVPSPNQSVPGQTVADTWDGHISTIGGGSDYTAFQNHAGIPSVDVGFTYQRLGKDQPVYHYHSNYDSFYWMSRFGDAGFAHHRAMAALFGLLTARLADLPVLPFRAADYATALDEYVGQMEQTLDDALAATEPGAASALSGDRLALLRARFVAHNTRLAAQGPPDSLKSCLRDLHAAIAKLARKASQLDAAARHLEQETSKERLPWVAWPQKLLFRLRLRKVNTKYKLLERKFLHPGGLDGRNWFKHVVFAPGLWTGYAGAVFPGLEESIDAADWANAQRWAAIIESAVLQAAHDL